MRHVPIRHAIIRAWIAPPLAIGVLVALGYLLRFGPWGRVWNLALAGAAIGWVAWLANGRWRDSAVSIAAILFTLAGIEAVAVLIQARPIDTYSPGYSVPHPVLGWAPGQPGVYHHVKRHRGNGAVIFDVRYTIDPHRARAVTSAQVGSPVAFLGDSFTFGFGVADADTLPQQFADAIGRRLPVLNLAMSGYGPQQVLRALETGLHDARLRGARLLVHQTAAFQAERASCWTSLMLRAPRYALVDGSPRYQGACYGDWWVALRGQITASATYHQLIAPILGGPSRAEMELYIAMLIRAGVVARDRYGAPLAILYIPRSGGYLANAAMTEAAVMGRLRDGGLLVVDAALDAAAFPGQLLTIPRDSHPTGTANHARAALLRDGVAQMLALPP